MINYSQTDERKEGLESQGNIREEDKSLFINVNPYTSDTQYYAFLLLENYNPVLL